MYHKFYANIVAVRISNHEHIEDVHESLDKVYFVGYDKETKYSVYCYTQPKEGTEDHPKMLWWSLGHVFDVNPKKQWLENAKNNSMRVSKSYPTWILAILALKRDHVTGDDMIVTKSKFGLEYSELRQPEDLFMKDMSSELQRKIRWKVLHVWHAEENGTNLRLARLE